MKSYLLEVVVVAATANGADSVKNSRKAKRTANESVIPITNSAKSLGNGSGSVAKGDSATVLCVIADTAAYLLYACDSDHVIRAEQLNGTVALTSDVLITLTAKVIKSGPFGNTPSPPKIQLPMSVI